MQIGQPGDDFGTETYPRSSNDPAWTVTESGAIHFVTRVDNINVHYYKKASETNFSKNAGDLIPNPSTRGEMYSYNNHVFMVELLGGKVNIKTTLEGQNDWEIIYTGQESTVYQHFDAFVEDDKLYVYLMENTGNNTVGEGDKRPLYFQEFTLSEVIDQENSEPIVVLEAEDFTTASTDIIIGASDAASNGEYIDSFSSNQFLEYNFSITESGNYDIVLFVAVRNRDDSIMDVEINGQLYENFLVAKTGDWNIYGENRIENVSLNMGENVIKLTQRRSLSSEPDKIEIYSKSGLNSAKYASDLIEIYPNPSDGIFQIQSNIQNLEYTLTNIYGQTVEKGKVYQHQVNFLDLKEGVYFLELKNDSYRSVKKIIIK